MLWAILMVLFYILVGAAVIIAAIFGAAWYLAREINAGHEPSCQCPTCQRKRLARWRARTGQQEGIIPKVNSPRGGRQWAKDRKPPPSRSEWISTLELKAGMKVLGKGTGKIFRVKSVARAPFGYVVVLVNELTRAESRIPVQGDKAQHRIWLVRRPKGSVE